MKKVTVGKSKGIQEDKKYFIYDIMRSNLALLWWGWSTVWGIIGIIAGCAKLWNDYA